MFLNKIRNIFCVPNTKFVSTTNVARAGKRGNICVGNNVSSFARALKLPKATGKRGHIVADTLWPTQMFPSLLARATFVADTNFVSGTQKFF